MDVKVTVHSPESVKAERVKVNEPLEPTGIVIELVGSHEKVALPDGNVTTPVTIMSTFPTFLMLKG